MGKKARRGTAPKFKAQPNPAQITQTDGYPLLSLRHCQSKWDFEELNPKQCKIFLTKWHKRAKLTWNDLQKQSRHGLGSEQLPKRVFKPSVPEELERDTYTVFRHEGNLPFVGFRAGDVFHVLWIEKKYGELYDH